MSTSWQCSLNRKQPYYDNSALTYLTAKLFSPQHLTTHTLNCIKYAEYQVGHGNGILKRSGFRFHTILQCCTRVYVKIRVLVSHSLHCCTLTYVGESGFWFHTVSSDVHACTLKMYGVWFHTIFSAPHTRTSKNSEFGFIQSSVQYPRVRRRSDGTNPPQEDDHHLIFLLWV